MSGRISTNTGRAPRRAIALAVETNVNDGRIASSPGPKSHNRAAISRAAVQDGVSSTLAMPNWRASSSAQPRVNRPSLANWPERIASATYWASWPAMHGRTNGMGGGMRTSCGLKRRTQRQPRFYFWSRTLASKWKPPTAADAACADCRDCRASTFGNDTVAIVAAAACLCWRTHLG